ncbi:MAG: hypothetical protein WCS27_17435, partial [Victivallaceae bacterium]
MGTKKFALSETDAIEYGIENNNLRFAGMALNGMGVLRDSLKFHYRCLDGWGEANYLAPQRKLIWTEMPESGDGVAFSGNITGNRDPERVFKLRMLVSRDTFSLHNREFTGISIRFAALSEIPFAMELEMSLPLSGMFKRAYIQDLYTADKCSSIDKNWPGFCWGIWQCQRSPFDFFGSDKGVLLTRLSSLTQLFSSKGNWEVGGPLLKYKFTLESESKWQSPALSFLVCREAMDQTMEKNLWSGIFLAESAGFRRASGIKAEKPLPMANIPIDGGTPGCNPPEAMKPQGKFDAFAAKAIALCEEMNFKRMFVGSPWISYRTLGTPVKTQPNLIYDSRCGIIDFEIAEEFGGRDAFRIFCNQAHERGIEVFVWYPGFHLANHSAYLTQHPEWIIRKADGSPYTYVYFHITAISPRAEVQKYFLENLRQLKQDCGFDGLWLDSYALSFHTLDFSRKQGVSEAEAGISMVKRLQDLGFKVINESYAPFGCRGDGEAMFFKGQEDAALDTCLFTYYKNLPE